MALILALAMLPLGSAEAAKSKITVSQAAWFPKTQTLLVKGANNSATSTVELYDQGGRRLATSTGKKLNFNLNRSVVPVAPCAVRVQAGNDEALVAVKGAPKDCAKAPLCQITAPAQGTAVSANADVGFAATATLKDKAAGPLTLEWDFAGGAMGAAIPGTNPTAYKRPDTAKTTVQFVRDNASYRVRFTAWDKKNRYCEDSVMVKVGNPPANLPNISGLVRDAQANAPKTGNELAGNKGDTVVLPFAEMTLPGINDYRLTPNTEVVTPPMGVSTLNAVVYRKDRLPVVMDNNSVGLKYSAASNPSDPVGFDSINSTSQNWPLAGDAAKSAPFQGAAVQKTDQWEIFQRPAGEKLAESYISQNWISLALHYDGREVGPDEGTPLNTLPGIYDVAKEVQGRYMPGKGKPFASNQPQDFNGFDPDKLSHVARAIPLTDTDDAGRINPLPLLRVEAVDKASGQTLASTDAVVGAAKDVHCRECHAKGKIAANDQFDWNAIKQAFHSSDFYASQYSKGGRGCWYAGCSNTFAPPKFFDSVDRDGKPSTSLADQEFAANLNISALHDFYDWTDQVGNRNGNPALDGSGITQDAPSTCAYCHRSWSSAEVGDPWLYTFPGYRGANEPTDAVGTLSEVMHSFHEQLQLDPGDPSKILRNEKGRPKLWDPAQGRNPNTLFPTVDAQGNALPMEQNCLRCHGGHREPLYRDRMYSAGVTCFDCHGDMAAVGSGLARAKPNTAGDAHRLGWYEQPDCGSCHIGNANQGRDGKNGFYSAGVMKRAFETSDRTAATRKPVTPRFAVQVTKPYLTAAIETDVLEGSPRYRDKPFFKTFQEPLYRTSKDKHGNVPCAACHGGAHEVWPNRDPKSNDNQTAMQLQGHTGTILECNVCHSADSFKNEADLDGGVYSGDAKPGILGGPHNLHPVNDPYWWKSTQGDDPNTDGTTYGGWHNNYAKQPGEVGEDQCAACHGNDHKGTRLSKTPVDRVFDFSGFDQAKLKRAGFKSKVVKVAAGTEIGCDTCHSIEISCLGSPAGKQCGVASATVPTKANRDPVITSTPGSLEAILGQPYRYQVTATDPDGDPLTYFIGKRPRHGYGGEAKDSMSIDQNGLVTYDWPQAAFQTWPVEPLTFPYTVTVTDGKGGYATQTVAMTLRCPSGQSWAWDSAAYAGSCELTPIGINIGSTPSISGLNAGEAYSYQVVATSEKGAPLGYSLEGAPAGMSISAAGLIAWTASAEASGGVAFRVKVTDGAGGQAGQKVTVNVCVKPEAWHSEHGMCM
jgi:hypothetical protein